MSSLTSNNKVQLAATAVVSAAVAAGAILSYQRLQKDSRLNRLKQSIPNPGDDESGVQKVNPPPPSHTQKPLTSPSP